MTYSPIQLDIIRTFGSKELSEGCLVKIKGDNWIRVNDYAKIIANHIQSGAVFVLYSVTGKGVDEIKMNAWLYPEEDEFKTLETLGHIPNLQDLFIIGKRKGFTIDISNREEIAIPIRTYWGTNHREFGDIEYDFSLPLIDQDESTLVQLLNLFK